MAGGNPAEGYQGGLYVNGLALFTPWQYHAATPHGTLLAYKGGPSGTFNCTTLRSCAQNWDLFDLTTLPTSCPLGFACPANDKATAYTCGQVVDSAGIVYYMPGAANQNPVMMSFNPNGNAGSGGTPVSNPANYAYFSAPTANPRTPLGAPYGWSRASSTDAMCTMHQPPRARSLPARISFATIRRRQAGLPVSRSPTFPITT